MNWRGVYFLCLPRSRLFSGTVSSECHSSIISARFWSAVEDVLVAIAQRINAQASFRTDS